MAGKSCRGPWATSVPNMGLSRTYCEGREAAAYGVLVGADPHQTDSNASAMWQAGHFSWDEGDPVNFLRDCCALAHGGGWTP